MRAFTGTFDPDKDARGEYKRLRSFYESLVQGKSPFSWSALVGGDWWLIYRRLVGISLSVCLFSEVISHLLLEAFFDAATAWKIEIANTLFLALLIGWRGLRWHWNGLLKRLEKGKPLLPGPSPLLAFMLLGGMLLLYVFKFASLVEPLCQRLRVALESLIL